MKNHLLCTLIPEAIRFIVKHQEISQDGHIHHQVTANRQIAGSPSDLKNIILLS